VWRRERTSTAVVLRNRTLIGVMSHSFTRVGALFEMRIEDYYPEPSPVHAPPQEAATATKCRRAMSSKPSSTNTLLTLVPRRR
jgi:hypothetical protein